MSQILGQSTSEQLKTDAIAHLRQLETSGQLLRGSFAHFAQMLPKAKNPENLLSEGTFIISGESAWIRFKDPKPNDAVHKSKPERVYGKTPNYIFSLRRRAGEAEYLLSAFNQPNAQLYEEVNESFQVYLSPLWGLEHRNLSDIEMDPNFKIESIYRDQSDHSLVKLKAKYSATRFSGTPSERVEDVRFVAWLDTRKHWAIHSYDSTITTTQRGKQFTLTLKTKIEYSDQPGASLPTPLRRITVGVDAQGIERIVHRIEYSDWVWGKSATESEVGLTAFGLPEPAASSNGSRRSIPGYLWFIAGAGLCILGSVALIRLVRAKFAPVGVSENKL
jgi:hypothetical protein